MNNLSLETTDGCCRVSTILYKQLLRSIKIFLILFLFAGALTLQSSAQTCTGMLASKAVACPNEVLTFTATQNPGSTGVILTWTIINNTSGAFFTNGANANLGTTITTTGAPGSNVVLVNTGPTGGGFTVNDQPGNGGLPCSASTNVDKVTVTASAPPIKCNGGTTTLTAVATSFQPAETFTYTINPGGTSNSTGIFSGLGAGTYTVTAVGNIGTCSGVSNAVTIAPAPSAITGTATGTNVSCFGGANGSATANPTGGTAPYTYLWSPGGGTTKTITGLAAGTYTVTVTDANSCTQTESYTVTQPASITGTATGANVSCFGGANGSATANPAGGTAPYTYLWSPGGGTTKTITGLAAGTYTVTVTDATGCTQTEAYTVTQPTAVSLSLAQANTPCGNANGGTITATFSGGTGTYMARIDGGAYAAHTSPFTFTGLVAGPHTVDVQDANLCVATQTITVGADQCSINVCSYTQGFWGNKNGLALMQSSGILNTQIIIGSTLGNSILIPAGSASITKINNVMPGGQSPKALVTTGQCNILTSCFDNNYLTKQGRINNVLLSQTITLSLNAKLGGGVLNTVPIQSGCLKTSAGSFAINANVSAYLACKGTATIGGLLALANAVLGGTLVPGQNSGGCIVPSFDDINSAVDAINNAFDECQKFLGYGPCI